MLNLRTVMPLRRWNEANPVGASYLNSSYLGEREGLSELFLCSAPRAHCASLHATKFVPDKFVEPERSHSTFSVR